MSDLTFRRMDWDYDWDNDDYVYDTINLDTFKELMNDIEAQVNNMIIDIVEIYTEVLGHQPTYLESELINDSYKYRSVDSYEITVVWEQGWSDGSTWTHQFPIRYLFGADWRTLERERAEKYKQSKMSQEEKEAQQKRNQELWQLEQLKKKYPDYV